MVRVKCNIAHDAQHGKQWLDHSYVRSGRPRNLEYALSGANRDIVSDKKGCACVPVSTSKSSTTRASRVSWLSANAEMLKIS